MTPAQCCRARGLLDWSRTDLATRALVSTLTIRNLEGGRGRPTAATVSAIRAALGAAGVHVEGGPDGAVTLRPANDAA